MGRSCEWTDYGSPESKSSPRLADTWKTAVNLGILAECLCRFRRFPASVMTYKNSRGEKQALQTRLKTLVDGRVVSLRKLQLYYSAWAKKNGLPFASRETLDNWMCSDFSNGKDPDWHHEKARSFSDFLKTRPEYNIQNSAMASLIHLLGNHFHAPHGMPPGYLNSLCGGPFAMFRRLWSKPESALYIRSLVTFTHDDGLFLYEEKQDFFDPVKGIQRSETDNGFVLVFGFNVYMMTLGHAVHCMKFMVMHDSDPVLDGKTKAGICRGNMIAIAGRGPHPGFKFIMKRIVDGDMESKIVPENDLDDDTKAYLVG
jgi:hypothetical protein